jgi:hypothetical protein
MPWVYAMANHSMAGLLKIGYTDREPEDRARELSAATGVPTPFILACAIEVDDAAALEGDLHARLDQVRQSSSREFFRVTVTEFVRQLRLLSEEQEWNPRSAIGVEIWSNESPSNKPNRGQVDELKRAASPPEGSAIPYAGRPGRLGLDLEHTPGVWQVIQRGRKK